MDFGIDWVSWWRKCLAGLHPFQPHLWLRSVLAGQNY
jgi:hypothetical protein